MRSPLRLSSIRSRVFTLVAIALAPMVLGAIWVLGHAGTRSVDDVRRQALASAQLAAREMDLAIRGLSTVLDTAASRTTRPGTATLDPREVLTLGGPMLDALELLVVRPDGRIATRLTRLDQHLDKVPVARRGELVQKALAGGPEATLVDEGIAGVRADTSGLVVVRALRPRPGCRCAADEAAALLAFVPGSAVRRVLNEDSLPAGSVALLLGSAGTPLVPVAQPERWLGRTAGDSVLRGTISDRSNSLLLDGVDGVARSYAFHRLAMLPWQAYVGIPLERADGAMGRLQLGVLALAALLLGVAWVAAGRVQRRILRPLRYLVGDMARVSEGDGDHRSVLAKVGGDVGAVGHAFNTMAAQVAQRTDSLATSLAREEQLVDRSPVATWLLDLPPTGGSRVRRANAAAGRLVGRSPRSMVGLRDADLFDATLSAVLVHVASPHEDAAQILEAPMLHANGSAVPCAFVIGKVPQGHQPALLVAAVPMPASDARADTPRLAAADAPAGVAEDAVARVAGRIGVDLEQAITTVLGYTDVAQQHADDTEMVRIAAREIHGVARRLGVLARQLRVVGRRQPLAIAPVDMRALLEQVAEQARPHLGTRVAIEVTTAEHAMPALADRAQVELALLALVMHARDAMPDGGTVRLSATHLGDGEEDHLPSRLVPGHYICLTVSDEGAGIPEPLRARLFEPWAAAAPESEGAGLGLAMVHGVVEQHGWVIAPTDDGAGTTFRVYLPLITRALPATATPRTVLLVEPTATRCALLRQQLAEAGYHVLVAATAAEAHVQRGDQQGSVDLLLVSEWLPDGAGDLLAEQLTADAPGMSVVLLTYTASEAAEVEETTHHLIDAGSPPRAVLEAVDRALTRARLTFDSAEPLSDDELDAIMLAETDEVLMPVEDEEAGEVTAETDAGGVPAPAADAESPGADAAAR